MERANRHPILIVGAGPTGLFLASELARYKVPFQIIDKRAAPTTTSNAAGIQTRTLEILSDVGMEKDFLEKGIACRHMQFYFDQHVILNIDFSVIDSIYKYILMLPQSETEAIIAQHLNQKGDVVEREHTLDDLKMTDSQVTAVINGEPRVFSWVIGCDGAHSTVRELCGISFPGEDIDERFIVADVHIEGIDDSKAINVFARLGKVLAIFPLGEHRYRIALNLSEPDATLTFDEARIKTMVSDRSDGSLTVISAAWISPFWIHSKLVPKMRCDRAFLVGDAAHIHSPVGGQGMNTGIQDAYNLAWKLAYVYHGNADDTILDSYERERWPVINDVVTRTEKATKMLITKNKLLVWLRNGMFKFLNNREWLKKKLAMRITQLSICYANSPIIQYDNEPAKGVKAGERAPDAILNGGKKLHSYFDNKKYNALIFTGNNRNILSEINLNKLKNTLNTHFGDTGHVVIIAAVPGINGADVEDADQLVHDIYQVNQPTIYITRPDNYVSAIYDDLTNFNL